jgi:ketose-bisphosphate aldolase
LQKEARKGKYAVPHFLGGSMEMIIAEVKAAEDKNSPLAIGFAPEVFYMLPMEMSLPLIVDAAKRARVPVATQLEHGRDFTTIMKAIKLGFTSVMFDGSSLPYEENIKKTREIVKIAHAFGVSVEAELGCVGGSTLTDVDSKESLFTDPKTVPDFIDKTGVDSLAISFGNFHGKYRGTPKLDYDRIQQISALVDTPLVMHGGSGLTEAEYRRCIECGISNIHFYTYVTLGLWEHLKQSVGVLDSKPVYHQFVGWIIEYFYKQTENVIDMLGSGNKAGSIDSCAGLSGNVKISTEDISSIVREVFEKLKNI